MPNHLSICDGGYGNDGDDDGDDDDDGGGILWGYSDW